MASVLRKGRRSGPTVQRRRWQDLSGRQRAMVIVVGSIELALTTTAGVDLWRRPSDQVRGPKAMWWPAIFVQPVGPVAYLLFGRRQGG